MMNLSSTWRALVLQLVNEESFEARVSYKLIYENATKVIRNLKHKCYDWYVYCVVTTDRCNSPLYLSCGPLELRSRSEKFTCLCSLYLSRRNRSMLYSFAVSIYWDLIRLHCLVRDLSLMIPFFNKGIILIIRYFSNLISRSIFWKKLI